MKSNLRGMRTGSSDSGPVQRIAVDGQVFQRLAGNRLSSLLSFLLVMVSIALPCATISAAEKNASERAGAYTSKEITQKAREESSEGFSLLKQSRFKEAEVLFRSAAQDGHPYAQVQLATLYLYGAEGVLKNSEEAFMWASRAVKARDWKTSQARAQQLLGTMYANGDGVRQDSAKAVDMLEKAVSNGNDQSAYLLGEIYRQGDILQQDGKKAENWYRRSIRDDDVSENALLTLGYMFIEGEGVEKDPDKAYKYIHKAVKQGSRRGIGYIRQHADKGNLLAKAHMGFFLYEGRITKKDEKRGLKLLHEAAENGIPYAEFALGRYFSHTTKSQADKIKGKNWLLKAAKKGYADAMHELAGWHFYAVFEDSGKLIDKYEREKEEIKWYRLAAEKGHIKATRTLSLRSVSEAPVLFEETEKIKWLAKLAEDKFSDSSYITNMAQEEFVKMALAGSELGQKYIENRADVNWEPRSLWAIGRMYEIQKELSKASKWYQLAAQRNYTNELEDDYAWSKLGDLKIRQLDETRTTLRKIVGEDYSGWLLVVLDAVQESQKSVCGYCKLGFMEIYFNTEKMSNSSENKAYDSKVEKFRKETRVVFLYIDSEEYKAQRGDNWYHNSSAVSRGVKDIARKGDTIGIVNFEEWLKWHVEHIDSKDRVPLAIMLNFNTFKGETKGKVISKGGVDSSYWESAYENMRKLKGSDIAWNF